MHKSQSGSSSEWEVLSNGSDSDSALEINHCDIDNQSSPSHSRTTEGLLKNNNNEKNSNKTQVKTEVSKHTPIIGEALIEKDSSISSSSSSSSTVFHAPTPLHSSSTITLSPTVHSNKHENDIVAVLAPPPAFSVSPVILTPLLEEHATLFTSESKSNLFSSSIEDHFATSNLTNHPLAINATQAVAQPTSVFTTNIITIPPPVVVSPPSSIEPLSSSPIEVIQIDSPIFIESTQIEELNENQIESAQTSVILSASQTINTNSPSLALSTIASPPLSVLPAQPIVLPLLSLTFIASPSLSPSPLFPIISSPITTLIDSTPILPLPTVTQPIRSVPLLSPPPSTSNNANTMITTNSNTLPHSKSLSNTSAKFFIRPKESTLLPSPISVPNEMSSSLVFIGNSLILDIHSDQSDIELDRQSSNGSVKSLGSSSSTSSSSSNLSTATNHSSSSSMGNNLMDSILMSSSTTMMLPPSSSSSSSTTTTPNSFEFVKCFCIRLSFKQRLIDFV
jgi:hypothetical protein